MDEEKEYLENKGLIYLAIKKEKIYWKTEDEFQDFVDGGTDGLLQGIRTYDPSLGIKKSTYYYRNIKFGLGKVISYKTRMKRNMDTVSLNKLIDSVDDTELIDMIPGNENVEAEVEKKIMTEKLIEMIDKLPIPKDRWVIKHMYGLDGYEMLNASELARKWGVNKNMIISRKNRAIRILYYRIRKEGL